MIYTHDGPVYIRGRYAYDPSKLAKVVLWKHTKLDGALLTAIEGYPTTSRM